MTFHEVVRMLRSICEVLKEYSATEARKRAEAARRVEEAKQKAEEAARQEALMRAAQERVLASRATSTTARRRSRRGEGPRVSTPVKHSPLPAAAATSAFKAKVKAWTAGGARDSSMAPNTLALMTELGRLDGAIRELLTATATSRRWIEKLTANRAWAGGLEGLMAGLQILALRISRRLYQRNRLLAGQRKWDEYNARVDRMVAGDWREKVRYLLWTNGQRQQREAAATVQ